MRKIYFLIRRTNTLSQLLKTIPRWIYLNSSRKKSDAGEVLINLIAKLQRQLDVKVKIIQCDGTWKFVDPAIKIKQYCTEKGIYIRFSSRDDSAENGVAECANET